MISPRQTKDRAGLWLALALTLWSAGAVWFFYAHGWLLYYGDAEAHLNAARRILDSQTPGYEQLGPAWLPLLHVLILPFARNAELWRSGLAGAIPPAVCFVVRGCSCLRRCGGSSAPRPPRWRPPRCSPATPT